MDELKNLISETVEGKKFFHVYRNSDGEKVEHGPFETRSEALAARLKFLKDDDLTPDDLERHSNDHWSASTGESYRIVKK